MDNAVEYPKFRFVVGFTSAWAWFTFGVIVLTYAPMLRTMSQEFHCPVGTLLIGLMSVNSIASGTGTLLTGPLVDKYGPRKVLLVSAILVLLYCILIPVCSHSVAQLVALRIYQGLAIGPLFSSMAALTQRWFPRKEQGTMIGINKGVFAVGSAVMFLLVPPLMQHFHGNWRLTAASAGVLMAVQVVLMIIIQFGNEPAMARRGGHGAAQGNDFKVCLALPVFWAGAVLLGIAQGVMQSVNGLVPSFLQSPSPLGLGFKPFISGHAIAFIQYGMIISGLVTGAILLYLFRGSAKWMAATMFLLAGIATYSIFLPTLNSSMNKLEVVFFVTGFLMNFGFPVVTAFITANYPPHILGKVFAISSGISVFGGAVFSAISASLLNATHSYNAVFAFLGVTGLLGFLITATMLNPVKAFKREAPQTAAAEAH